MSTIFRTPPPTGVIEYMVSIPGRKWAIKKCREFTEYFCPTQFEMDKSQDLKARYGEYHNFHQEWTEVPAGEMR